MKYVLEAVAFGVLMFAYMTLMYIIFPSKAHSLSINTVFLVVSFAFGVGYLIGTVRMKK